LRIIARFIEPKIKRMGFSYWMAVTAPAMTIVQRQPRF